MTKIKFDDIAKKSSTFVSVKDFGIKGDGVTDDGPLLLSVINNPLYRDIVLPPGKYKSSVALIRTDGLNVTIRGAGAQNTTIEFTGDTDGLKIINTDTGASSYGAVNIHGIAITSAGTKSAGKIALQVSTQHYQRPGPILRDIAVKSLTVGQEWSKGIYIYDCSGSNISEIDIELAATTSSNGIEIASRNNIPSVEHNIANFAIRSVKVGIYIHCEGAPGVEGVQLSNGSIVTCFQGVKAVATAYGAPYVGLNNIHINSFGGESVYLDGYQQCAFSRCLFYANSQSSPAVTPARAVYINKSIFTAGDFLVVTYSNIPNAVELDGAGGAYDLDVRAIVSAASTNSVKVNAAVDTGATIGGGRVWDGNTTWGTTQGVHIVGPGKGAQKFAASPKTPFSNGGLLYNDTTYLYESVTRARLNRASIQTITTSTTIDLSTTDAVVCYNNNTNITITVDWTKVIGGEKFHIIRADAGTGTITITTSDPNNNKTVTPNVSYLNEYVLPNTDGIKQYEFITTTAHLYIASPFGTAGTLSTAVRGDNDNSRSSYETAPLSYSPSGFKTFFDQTNTPNPNGWPFHAIRVRHAQDSTTNLTYSWDLLSHFKTGALYTNTYDAQDLVWLGYKRIHDNRWFPVKETMTPVNGDTLKYNSTTGLWENAERTVINVKDFGAVGDGITNDSTAFQNAINHYMAASTVTSTINTVSTSITKQLKIFVPPGIYKFNSGLLKPQSFIGLDMYCTPGTVIFDYSSLPNFVPFLTVRGGSGRLTNSIIEGFTFIGQANSIGLQIDGQCGQHFNKCEFRKNLVGVKFFNDTGGAFTEWCTGNQNNFTGDCKYALQYSRTIRDTATYPINTFPNTTNPINTNYVVTPENNPNNGRNSFHGTGLVGENWINTSSTNGNGCFIIDDGCLPYNSPMNVQVWVNSDSFLFQNNNSGSFVPYFNGKITVEHFVGTLTLATNKRMFFSGPIQVLGDYVDAGLLYQCENLVVNQNNTYEPLGLHYNARQLSTGTSTVLNNFPIFGGMYQVFIQIIGTNHDRRYVLVVDENAANIMFTQRDFNVAGFGATTFTLTSNKLTVNNANYTSGNVTIYYTVNQIGDFINGNVKANTF